MKKQVLSFRLEPDLIEAINILAKKQNRTKGNLVNLIIKNYLQNIKKD